MLTELNIRVSESVPRDEVWFVQRLPWEAYHTPTGIAFVEHLKIVGKIRRISGSISNQRQ